MEIRHVPSYYDKNQLLSLTSTKLVFFENIHIKQVCGLPATSWVNDYNVLFPRNEEGKVDAGRGIYEMSNQPKKSTFKYEQEGRFYLGVAKVEIKEYGAIPGKSYLVFDYTGKENDHDRCSKKRNPKMNSQE